MFRGPSLGREFVNRSGVELLARLQNRGRKLGVGWRVWKMLGFETERVAAVVDLACLAANPIQEVAGIKLKPGFGSRHFEQAS